MNEMNETNSVCISGYPLFGHPDLSVNFMAAQNPDILKWKSGCCGCSQKVCKLCLWYCGGTSNYSKSNSHVSKEWMVTFSEVIGLTASQSWRENSCFSACIHALNDRISNCNFYFHQ